MQAIDSSYFILQGTKYCHCLPLYALLQFSGQIAHTCFTCWLSCMHKSVCTLCASMQFSVENYHRQDAWRFEWGRYIKTQRNHYYWIDMNLCTPFSLQDWLYGLHVHIIASANSNDSLTGHNIAFCGLLGKSVNAEALVSLLNNFHWPIWPHSLLLCQIIWTRGSS